MPASASSPQSPPSTAPNNNNPQNRNRVSKNHTKFPSLTPISAFDFLQGSDLDLSKQPPPQIRSPLAEKLTSDRFPKSPLLFSSNTSGHALPPLKFHAGLLAPHSLVAPSCLSSDMDVDDGDEESLDSVADDYSGANFFDEESKAQTEWYQEEEESVGYSNKGRSGLNMGFLKEGLRVEVPGNNFRRFTESEVGFK